MSRGQLKASYTIAVHIQMFLLNSVNHTVSVNSGK